MLFHDGFSQFARTASRGVFGEAGLDGLHSSLADVFRSDEIGLAGTKVHNVNALLPQLACGFSNGRKPETRWEVLGIGVEAGERLDRIRTILSSRPARFA